MEQKNTPPASGNPVHRAYREIMGTNGVSPCVVAGEHSTQIIPVDYSDPAFKTRVKEMVAVLTPAFMENKTRNFWEAPHDAHVPTRHCMFVSLMRHANIDIVADPHLLPVNSMAHSTHLKTGGDYYGEDYKVALAILSRAGEIETAQKGGPKPKPFKNASDFDRYCENVHKLTAFRGVAAEGEKVLNEAFLTDPEKTLSAKEDKAAKNKITALIAAFDVATAETPKMQHTAPKAKPFSVDFAQLQQNFMYPQQHAPFDFSKAPTPPHKAESPSVGIAAPAKAVTYTTREGDTFYGISQSKAAAPALAQVKASLGDDASSKDAALALSLIIARKNLELSRRTARKDEVVDTDYVPCCGTKLLMPSEAEVKLGLASLKAGILQDGKINYSREMKHQQVEDLVSLTGAKPASRQR